MLKHHLRVSISLKISLDEGMVKDTTTQRWKVRWTIQHATQPELECKNEAWNGETLENLSHPKRINVERVECAFSGAQRFWRECLWNYAEIMHAKPSTNVERTMKALFRDELKFGWVFAWCALKCICGWSIKAANCECFSALRDCYSA